jgi:hypothetical protein
MVGYGCIFVRVNDASHCLSKVTTPGALKAYQPEYNVTTKQFSKIHMLLAL